MLGYIIFRFAFTCGQRKSKPKMKPVSKFTDKLMGPGFESLLAAYINNFHEAKKYPFEPREITASDGIKLRANYCRCENPNGRTAVFVHGYNSTGFEGNSVFAIEFMKRGYNVLLPDNRNCGESEGKHVTFGVKESEDTLLWINKLIEESPEEKIIVYGESLGGATTAMLAGKDLPENVKCLIPDCPYAELDKLLVYLGKHMAGLNLSFLLKPVDFWNKRINGCSFEDTRPIDAVATAKVPMLFVHGREDRFIPVENSLRLYEACPTEKDMIIVDGAGHTASFLRGGEKFWNTVLNFADKYTSD